MKIIINETPIAQGRPRFKKCGNYIQTYEPYKSKQYKEKLQYIFKKEIKNIDYDYTAPLKMEIMFTMPTPKSWSKKKTEAYEGQAHTNKPDIDNLTKAILDAGNKILYKDDSQIVEINVIKQWGKMAKIEMKIYEKK